MKVSKAKAADNRDAIIQAAASQIRSRGFDQLNVSDVARAAGLTHGALYSHFQSKDALTAEATRRAFDESLRDFTGLSQLELVHRYLSTQHRDNPEEGCPTAALVSEVRRQPAELQAAFRIGIDRSVTLMGESLEAVGAEHDHDRAVFMFAAMVGGLALSRAVRNIDEPASANILRAIRDQIRLLTSMPSNPPHAPSPDMGHTPHGCLADNLRSANRAIARYYGKYLRDAEVGPIQFTVLMHLYDLGEVSMTKLAREMETDRTTMARNISVLERNGHVVILGSGDRRARKVSLTDKGLAAFKYAFPLWQEAQKDLRHLLGQDLWINLTKQMRMLAAIEPKASKRATR